MQNNIDYNSLLDNLQILYGLENSEKLFHILVVTTELMIQIADDNLSGAEYTNEFKHDRMKFQIFIEKK